MPSTWGDKIGRGSNGQLGQGVQVSPLTTPKVATINYSKFRGGLMLSDRPGDVPANYLSQGTDIEVSRRDGVIRAPGVVLSEDTAHPLNWWAIHTSLDFQSVLVAFAPPFIGVKEAGNFIWTDQGLLVGGDFWVSSNYGDVLVFSNGRALYSRSFDSGLISPIAGGPGAVTLFTAFGRLFAGGPLLGGDYNLLGIMWNGVNGDYTDWSGIGSGAELLIADTPQGDRIIAGRILSYQIVAILCRRSLWIAQQTGIASRPADFQFRIIGIGCVSERTARTTEGGVTFLSDEGVRHFNGNDAEMISGAINSELLPIDFTQITKYVGIWDSTRRRYILGTPTATYVFQFPSPDYPQGAWFKRSITPDNIILFARQTADPTWDDMGDQTWDDMGDSIWADFTTPETNAPADVLFALGTSYGTQDYAETANLGVETSPVFVPRPDETPAVNMAEEIFVTTDFYIEYIGSGNIEIWGYDEVDTLTLIAAVTLPNSSVPKQITADTLISTKARGIEVRIVGGSPEILRIRQSLLDNGPELLPSFDAS